MLPDPRDRYEIPEEVAYLDSAAVPRAHDVHVSGRRGGLRVSPHLHVTDADIARFGAALGEAMRG